MVSRQDVAGVFGLTQGQPQQEATEVIIIQEG